MAETPAESTQEDMRSRPLAEQAVRQLAEQTAEAAAEKAALKAIQLTFLYLGVDITHKESLEKLKLNLQFLDRTAAGATTIRTTVTRSTTAAVLLFFSSMVFLGFKDTIVSWFAR